MANVQIILAIYNWFNPGYDNKLLEQLYCYKTVQVDNSEVSYL